MNRQPLKPCGTPAAYRRHLRHGEEPCSACRRAHTDEVRVYQRRGYVPPRELRPHGTEACYQRELRRGEPTCEKCCKAHAAYVLAYKNRKRAAA